LPGYHTKSNNDQASDGRRCTCTDERVSKAELVDRNTKPDHDEPRKKGKNAYAKQQNRHPFSILSEPTTFAVACWLNSSGNDEFSLFRTAAATAKVK
jgi:hypothetical protein